MRRPLFVFLLRSGIRQNEHEGQKRVAQMTAESPVELKQECQWLHRELDLLEQQIAIVGKLLVQTPHLCEFFASDLVVHVHVKLGEEVLQCNQGSRYPLKKLWIS